MISWPLRIALFGLLAATTTRPAIAANGYVGAAACGSCHATQLALWRGSHHDRAMEEAGEQSVTGDFKGTTFSADGEQSTFSRKNGRFVVRTQGSDGKPHEYPVAYTFGIEPLQQYLIAFPGGAYQALTTAWDTRPRQAGGQRWFDLYPDEKTPPGDVLHWTGPGNNWNRMCADCHSTNLRTKYSLTDKRYETTWSEIDVACEACHGPGERHAKWAKERLPGAAPAPAGEHGLSVDLGASSAGSWVIRGSNGIAHIQPPRTSRAEVDTCAACHSRRTKIADDVPGDTFLDGYRPALLDEGLYFADGQIEDEVYEWGSFVQSRMFHAGVTCSDCHEPHSLRLRAEGNAVCNNCHLPAKFDTPAHHHHARASRAALCVECHMPARTYMVVDTRRDHGLRVPRPELSTSTGAPNACNGCHRERTAEWAAQAINTWQPAPPRPHFAEAIAAGRRLGHGAGKRLLELIVDNSQPSIARATALGLLPGFAVEDTLVAVRATVDDGDALLRAASAGAATRLPPQMRAPVAQSLLDDRVRLVRLEAARALAASRAQLDENTRQRLDRALTEYEQAQQLNADQPQSHVNLGALYVDLGRFDDAERAYRAALEVGPYFVPAYVNLADLYRGRGQEARAEASLRQGLERAPEEASLHHSLGLTMVRQGRSTEALEELRRARELAPATPRYTYVYGVALNSLGQRDAAIKVLEEARKAHPADFEIAAGLAMIKRDAGRTDEALKHAREIAAEWPASQAARQLLEGMARRSTSNP